MTRRENTGRFASCPYSRCCYRDSPSSRADRRERLLHIVAKDLATAAPLRPRIAAELLELSEKTVRAWAEEGFLTRADAASSRVLLDVPRVHQVLHVLKDLRAAGRTTGLLDEVYRRLVDATWLERDDLLESIEQMSRGEGTTRVPKPKSTARPRRPSGKPARPKTSA